MSTHKLVNGKQVPLSSADKQQQEADKLKHAQRLIDNKYQEIKNIASKRILEIAPEWKQRNIMVRAVELVEINGGASLEEIEELNAIRAIWARIRAVRSYSDSLEARVDSVEDKLSVDIETGWPE